MPIRPPKDPSELQNKATLDRWCRATPVTPSDDSVGTDQIKAGAVTDGKLRDSAGSSVIGRASSTSGTPTDIVLTDGQFLVSRSGVVGGGQIQDTDLPTSIARDTEITAAITAHEAALDPHPVYTTASELSATLAAYAQIETTGVYTGAFTGTATDPAPQLRWSKIGHLVALYLPQANATSNATTFTITGAPAAIQPARAQTMLAIVRDNGTVSYGIASMGTGGTLTLGLGAAGGTFTASGTKGVELQTLLYSVD